MTRPRRVLSLATAATALLLTASASAQNLPEPENRAVRRSGFMFAVQGGYALGYASGNPAAQARRFDPDFTTSGFFPAGYRLTPFIAGALTDWFVFGLGATFAQYQSGSHRSPLGAFLIRIESFPLFYRGGAWRDLGVSMEFGAGGSNIRRSSDDKELASAGVASTLGLGAFWETWRFGHLAAGPFAGYQYNWSDHFDRHELAIGLRGTFYGGP